MMTHGSVLIGTLAVFDFTKGVSRRGDNIHRPYCEVRLTPCDELRQHQLV